MRRTSLLMAFAALAVLVLGSCQPKSRMGMVVDPDTGLQYGSVVSGSLTMDPSLLKDTRLKIRLRNTSGDPVFNLQEFRTLLEQSYEAQGYEIVRDGDFGVLLDVNVVYSGQATETMALEYGLLGAGGGAAAGFYGNQQSSSRGAQTGMGAVSGAALGAVIGNYVRDETFCVVSQISVAIPRSKKEAPESTIVFSESRKRRKEEMRRVFRQYRHKYDLTAASYAGGQGIDQSAIAQQVRERFYRIVANIM
ncbi:MAG: complement resistance protein TraT [Desulfovibrionaceae bacterium]